MSQSEQSAGRPGQTSTNLRNINWQYILIQLSYHFQNISTILKIFNTVIHDAWLWDSHHNRDHAGAGKIWENQFYAGKLGQWRPKCSLNVRGHLPRIQGSLSKLVFVHYPSRISHSPGDHPSFFTKLYLLPNPILVWTNQRWIFLQKWIYLHIPQTWPCTRIQPPLVPGS